MAEICSKAGLRLASCEPLMTHWASLHYRKKTLTRSKTRQSFDREERLLCDLVANCYDPQTINEALINDVVSCMSSTNIDVQESAIKALGTHCFANL